MRSRTWAWMVTSREVVGSSAMRSFGSAGESDGDHHALPHPAGQLMRKFANSPGRVLNSDHGEHFGRARPRFAAGDALVQPHGLADLAPGRQAPD